jgi:alanine-synthesizing transaminase
VAIPTATPYRKAFRVCARRSATGTRPATTSTSIPRSEAIATIGSKEGIAHLALATLDRGDIVLVPNPSYPIHIYGPVIAGADIRHLPMVPGVNFFEEMEKAIKGFWPRPKMLILNFPSNPTTQCVELEFFEKVVAMAKEYGILVVHDIAYADIVFDGYKAPSIMQVPGAKDVAVEFFTLSKSYNMPGWRVGFMVGNARLVCGSRSHQELSRLRYLHADSGRRHHSARRPAGLR